MQKESQRKYYYVKTINNNAISARDDRHHEVIILGKAIGVKCQRQIGALIDPALIERVFTAQQQGNYLETLLAAIPYSLYQIVDCIIRQAEKDLHASFKDALYLSLLDHIHFSLRMHRKQSEIPNPLLTEIKLFHKEEFAAALHSVAIINEHTHANLDENEAGYLAFHYINALSLLDSRQNKQRMQLLNQILIYIRSLGIHLDENSYLYARLVTHLKLLLNRILSGECEEHAGFARSLSESLASEHLQGWEYARSIYSFMSEQLQLRVHQEEITYLAMHIVPLLQREEGKNDDEDSVHTQEGGKEKTDVKIQTTGSRHH